MRIITYFGKGGVGKTTLAAATALACAARGHQTLLMSVSAGHNLGDVLGITVGNAPTSVAPKLDVREVSALAEMRARWAEVQDYVATILRGIGTGKSAYVQEVVLFPALEELTAMTEIWRAISEQRYDVVVVDTPPTAGMMTLLAGPEGLKWLLSSVETWYRRLALLATPVMQALFPNRNPMDMLPEIGKRVGAMRAALTNPEVASHRLVTRPEQIAIKDGLRLATYHYLYECPVESVFANRVRGGTAGEKAALELLRSKVNGLPVIEIPEQPDEPVGVKNLTQFAEQVFVAYDPLAQPRPAPLMTLEAAADNQYALKLRLPNLELERLDLVTRAGELVLEIGHFKRNILLPAEVRSREAVGADYNGDLLTITFA